MKILTYSPFREIGEDGLALIASLGDYVKNRDTLTFGVIRVQNLALVRGNGI